MYVVVFILLFEMSFVCMLVCLIISFVAPHTLILDQVDHVSSLERAAHTTLCLVQDLHSSTAQLSSTAMSALPTKQDALPSLRTPLERDTERPQFIMKLAPRIRRLESDTITCLTARLERVLQVLQQKRHENGDSKEQDESQTEVRAT